MLDALYSKDIDVMVIHPEHQFSNYSERIIQEENKILNILRDDINCSIFRQPQTMLELIGNLALVESFLFLRPVLVMSKTWMSPPKG